MREIRILPFTFSYDTSKDFIASDIVNWLKDIENKIQGTGTQGGRRVIGRIISFSYEEDTNGIIKRLFLRLGTNFPNNRTKAKIKNNDVSSSGKLDSTETILNDLVLVFTFPGTGSTVFSLGGIERGLLYLIYEGHQSYAIQSLDYIINDTFKDYSIEYSSFSTKNKPLHEVIKTVKEFESDLVSVVDEKEEIIGKTFIKKKGFTGNPNESVEKLKNITDGLLEFLEGNFEEVKRKFYINAMGKKIQLNDDGAGNYSAIGFPQQINVSDFLGEYKAIKDMFFKILKPSISDGIEEDVTIKMGTVPFVEAYEKTL